MLGRVVHCRNVMYKYLFFEMIVFNEHPVFSENSTS